MADGSKRGFVLRDILLLSLGIGFFYFGTLWMRPLANPDESRYAEIAREMALSGDWVTPRLNGVLYFEKPPICYWLSAVSIKVAGLREGALRFWPAALGLITCLVVYATGRRIYGRAAGLASACILATTLLWFALGQILILDMAVSAFAAIALCLFLLATREPAGRIRLWLLLGVYACLALATLAKGFMGFLVPGAVMFLWTLLLNQWRRLVPLHLWIGVPLFLIIVVPWHVLAARATPAQAGSTSFFSSQIEGQGFLWYYVVHEQVLRYLTSIHRRTEPFWYFFAVLPAGLFPWITLLPQALKSAFSGAWSQRQTRREEWFFGIWALFILLFFSTSQSKLIPYILPAYPALALLLGRFSGRIIDQSERASLRAALLTFGGVTTVLAVAAALLLTRRDWVSNQSKWVLIVPLTAGLITSAALAYVFAIRRDWKRGLLAPVLCSVVVMALFNPLAGQMRPSMKPLCQMLKPRLTADTPVFSLNDYLQDLPVYLDRLISVADYTPPPGQFEQEFGLSIERHADRYLDQAAFREIWRGSTRAYAVMTASRYRKYTERNADWHPHVIFKDDDFVLLSNQPDS